MLSQNQGTIPLPQPFPIGKNKLPTLHPLQFSNHLGAKCPICNQDLLTSNSDLFCFCYNHYSHPSCLVSLLNTRQYPSTHCLSCSVPLNYQYQIRYAFRFDWEKLFTTHKLSFYLIALLALGFVMCTVDIVLGQFGYQSATREYSYLGLFVVGTMLSGTILEMILRQLYNKRIEVLKVKPRKKSEDVSAFKGIPDMTAQIQQRKKLYRRKRRDRN